MKEVNPVALFRLALLGPLVSRTQLASVTPVIARSSPSGDSRVHGEFRDKCWLQCGDQWEAKRSVNRAGDLVS